MERFAEAGDVTDLGEASSLASGTAGSGELSYALYRVVLDGEQPGIVSADVNLRQRSDTSPSVYWLGLSRYDQGVWDWHGPFSDSHVRLSTAKTVGAGATYLSPLGNLFLCVVASNGAAFDVVGLGVNKLKSGDSIRPPTPAVPLLTPVASGLLIEWLPVTAGDLAGYQLYYSSQPFIDQQSLGLKQETYLVGNTRHLLSGLAGRTYLRISALDLSGNESALSEITSATPLPGAPPPLSLSISAPSSGLDEIITLSASGADSYDWDLDGDGSYDVTGDASGIAAVDTSRTGIIRPAVRGSIGAGTTIVLGGFSLIITGNSWPAASATADPQSGDSPLIVNFSGMAEDAEDEPAALTYAWDFDGDGIFEAGTNTTAPDAQVYMDSGLYNIKFRAEDSAGAWDVDTVAVQVNQLQVFPPNYPPIAQLSAQRTTGNAPYAVEFDASDSADVDGFIMLYEWDWEGDGVYDENTSDVPATSHTYQEAGLNRATVRVMDNQGEYDTASLSIVARGVMIKTVDSASDTGRSTSLAIVNGRPAISYIDREIDYLRYVRASNADGTSWESSVVVDNSGEVEYQNTSLVVVNGKPAIAYWNTPNKDLMYVQATDANGNIWASPLTVESTGDVGFYLSMAVVDGNPAISYYDDTVWQLKYVRAFDADGFSWNTPVTPDSTAGAGSYTSLVVVNGNPAISYYDYTNEWLKYVRATDTDGATWSTPVIPDSGNVGAYTSMAIINGTPAICYTDWDNTSLKYVRAMDSDGAVWNPPLTVDNDGDAGYVSCLRTVAGRPAISYYVAYPYYSLKYIRATDASGTLWGGSQILGDGGFAGWEASLAVVNGNPAVSYYNAANFVLKYCAVIE